MVVNKAVRPADSLVPVSSCVIVCCLVCRSLESFSRCCVDWRWLSPRWLPPRLDVLLFAAGVGAILHCYSDSNGVHRDVFRSKYLGVFDFVFGNTGTCAVVVARVTCLCGTSCEKSSMVPTEQNVSC